MGIPPLISMAPRPVQLDLGPAEVAARLRHLPGLVFFDSAKADPESLSIISAAPSSIIQGSLFTDAQQIADALAANANLSGADDGLPHGFLAGSVDYDCTYQFGVYHQALIYRHQDQRWYEVGKLRSALRSEEPLSDAPAPRLAFCPAIDPEHYMAMVRRAQRYIAAGDIYQVNLAHRFSARFGQDDEAWPFYEALRNYSPAPHAAYLDQSGRTILSTSPELFLKMSGRSVRTRPIKGTRPRRADTQADEKSALDLLTSPKEVSELVMITDLERNDLGRVCEYGTVHVPELLKLERHEQVFHLVSTVEGRLREGATQVDALQACFPGGSITGAPKIRAREIIAELERTPRGLYTGAIGWLGFNGESQFSIAIRTVVAERDTMHFHVGAGIVADSDPAAEWQETLDKASGILLAADRCQ